MLCYIYLRACRHNMLHKAATASQRMGNDFASYKVSSSSKSRSLCHVANVWTARPFYHKAPDSCQELQQQAIRDRRLCTNQDIHISFREASACARVLASLCEKVLLLRTMRGLIALLKR